MSVSITATEKSATETFPENKIIFIWSLTVWLVVMNTTMFNVALPTVLIDLSITSSTASWIVSGYSIVFAIATLTFSRLSDFVPIAKLLVVGLTILGVASVIGFLSNDFYVLLGARILQAAGAGAVPGLAMVLAGRYIPLSRRGKAMAFISSAASLGFGLGPVIGGVITQYLGWNYLFTVTGFVVLLIPLFQKLLPKEEAKIGKFDIIGGILTGLSVTGLLLFLSTFSFLILVCSLILIISVWIHFQKIEIPFIQPSLLKNKQFIKLIYIGFAAFVIHFATLFLMPIILSAVFNKEPLEVGILIFPGAILSAITAQFIGRLIDRFGNAPLIIFGQIFLVIATVMFAFTSTISSYFILFTYVFMSIGFSTINASVSNEVTRILLPAEIGSGMGIVQLIQFFGGALGVTFTGLLITLQKGISAEIVYRNIFGMLFFLIISAIVLFALYYLNKRKNRYST